MNCESVRDLLSAFYDRELPTDREAQVREHVEQCPDCARRLVEFGQLSQLTTRLRNPNAPRETWPAIASALDDQESHKGGVFAGRMSSRSRLAMAASLLLAASMAIGYWTWRTYEPHAVMAAAFDVYLKEFQSSPEQAQRVLIDRYDGRPLDFTRASSESGFEPNAPEELPDGFVRQGAYVLKMPCCTCTQTIYKNKSGAVLALFEHSEEQQVWFGDRPRIEAVCHDTPTHLVQLPGQLAATWKCGQRYLTVIGAQNVEQVAELVARLDGRS
jgi:hypothetical protein